jgi:probable addiction module antidote protein
METLMPKLAKNAPKYPDTPNSIVAHLSRVLERDDPMTFQKVLLDIAFNHGLASVAEQAEVRRETLWRYKTGTVRAPFDTLVKIMAAVGIKLVVVAADPAS